MTCKSEFWSTSRVRTITCSLADKHGGMHDGGDGEPKWTDEEASNPQSDITDVLDAAINTQGDPRSEYRRGYDDALTFAIDLINKEKADG